MTEEEGLVRAVVTGAGDDAPRLAYADWLEDHGDPRRAAYLRAEREWARPWRAGTEPADRPELRRMAAALDPVWVARVSRPPLGVCCDHLRLSDGGVDPPTAADLKAIEEVLGETFPPQLTALLLNTNGGALLATGPEVSIEVEEWVVTVRELASVARPAGRSLRLVHDLEAGGGYLTDDPGANGVECDVLTGTQWFHRGSGYAREDEEDERSRAGMVLFAFAYCATADGAGYPEALFVLTRGPLTGAVVVFGDPVFGLDAADASVLSPTIGELLAW